MDENIREISDTINEFLINITDRIDDISNRYRTENVFEEDRILNMLDDLNALTEGTSVIGPYYETIDLYELQEKLSFMAEALEKNDFPAFIDTISYELKPLLEFWSGLLTKK